jgi:site-specific DNA recombinase
VPTRPTRPKFWEKRRSQHLLAGKSFCGTRGGAFSAVGRDSLACSAARRQGTCSNRAGIRRPVLDGLILDAMRRRLMAPDCAAVFVEEFTTEWNRAQAEASATISARQREYDAVQRKLSGLIDAIADGLRAPGLQQKLDELEARKMELATELTTTPAPAPRLHPNLSEIYRRKVSELEQALRLPGDGTAALEAARSLIERIVLHETAGGKGLEIELIGEIAAMVSLSLGKVQTPRSTSDLDLFFRSVKVVAGAGFEPAAFRL